VTLSRQPETMDFKSIVVHFKQSTAIKNKLHSLGSKGQAKGKMIRSLKRQLKQLQKEIQLLEIICSYAALRPVFIIHYVRLYKTESLQKERVRS
jgi:hypothetical protein